MLIPSCSHACAPSPCWEQTVPAKKSHCLLSGALLPATKLGGQPTHTSAQSGRGMEDSSVTHQGYRFLRAKIAVMLKQGFDVYLPKAACLRISTGSVCPGGKESVHHQPLMPSP